MEKTTFFKIVASIITALTAHPLFSSNKILPIWSTALANQDWEKVDKIHTRLYRIYSTITVASPKVDIILYLTDAISATKNDPTVETVLQCLSEATNKATALGIEIPFDQPPAPHKGMTAQQFGDFLASV